MKKLTALPAWWGLFMIILAGAIAFPAIGHIMEGYHHELWEFKLESMGSTYSHGVLIWSFGAIIISAYFIGKGLEILITSDPKAQND